MDVSSSPTVRLGKSQVRALSRRPNAAGGSVYVSRAAQARPDARIGVERLRRLAGQGDLARVAGAARGYDELELNTAAYDVVWPIVFGRLTRRLEQQRGHSACAAGVGHLTDECLDRFQDDVEAVVEDLLTHARQPIHHLEAWVSARLGAATVNAHRRRRGLRGALQRPRLPGWLVHELGQDRWLLTLATNMLVWVGLTETAGTEVWPLDSWAHERAACIGDWSAGNRAAVVREIGLVTAAMRTHPDWYESFVERPLGAKRAPVAVAAENAYGEPATPLILGDPGGTVDTDLARLAGDAVRIIDRRVGAGEEPAAAVAEVIRDVFGGIVPGSLDRAPHVVADPVGGVTGALSDRKRLDGIVSTVLSIVAAGE